jgi:hypothetical protein
MSFGFVLDKPSDSGPEKAPDQKNPGTDIFGIIIGSSAALITILVAIVIFIIFRHRIKKKKNNRRLKAAMTDNHNTISINLSDLRNSANGKMLNGNLYNGVPATDMDSDRECCSGKNFFFIFYKNLYGVVIFSCSVSAFNVK